MTRPPNPGLVDALLSIATDLIAEKGAGDVTLREIAAQAGVTTTTIHYYFESRAGLFEAAKLRAIDALDNEIAARVDPAAGAAEQLSAVAAAFVSWSLANPHAFALVFEALPPFVDLDDELTGRYYASFVRLREIYARGAATGEFEVDDVDLEATRAFAAIYGTVELALNKRLPPQYWIDPSPVFDRAMARVLAALTPRRGRPDDPSRSS